MRKHVLAGLAVFLCMPVLSFSADRDLSFSSIRQRGMGGSGVALTFDEHALYKNPAGLSRATTDFNLPRLRVEASNSIINNLSTFQDIAKSGSGES